MQEQEARRKVQQLKGSAAAQRAPASADVQAARETVARFETLVQADAAPRVELQDAQARHRAAEQRLDALALSSSSALSDAEARARALALALEVKALEARSLAAQAAQVVRSPVAGEVAEIRQGQATARGLSVEVVILVKNDGDGVQPLIPVEEAAPPTPQDQSENLNAPEVN